MNISEMLAKILANENLTVEQKNTPTAYFDLQERRLVLPMWKDMSPTLETMLVCHEVGHALFTPLDYVETIKNTPDISHILNVIEDPREERLFKERYPGSRKDFIAASKELYDNDILGIGSEDINSMNFIDRLNAYFKLGTRTGVKFQKDEVDFVRRASATVTFEEAKKLAFDIYDFLKEKAESFEASTLEQIAEDGDPSEEEDFEFVFSGKGEESDQDFDYGTPATANGEQLKRLITSKTILAQENKLQEYAANVGQIQYITIPDHYNDDPIIPYSEILSTCDEMNTGVALSNQFLSFKQAYGKQVQHLVSLFEMKKSAAEYARRSVKKTGYLDTKKLATYKLKDNIFLQSMVLPEGKNHGMVLLLDWSGSMLSGNTLGASINQVVQLVMFCRSLSIPYRVFAFVGRKKDLAERSEYDKYTREHHFNLMELFTNEMPLKDHTRMVEALLNWSVARAYSLSNTPLAPALIYMRRFLPKFQQKYRIDKLNLIAFTDGGNTSRIPIDWEAYTVYIKDEVTKKNYLIRKNDTKFDECNSHYQILKDRYGVNITTYYAHTNGSLSDAIEESGWTGIVEDSMIDKFRKERFLKLKGFGRDALYIVSTKILLAGETEIGTMDSNMTSSAIARSLKKTFKGSLKNKVLLENFADSIS